MAKPQAKQTKNDNESFSEEETERRRDDALKRALGTPPRQHQEDVGKGKRREDEFPRRRFGKSRGSKPGQST